MRNLPSSVAASDKKYHSISKVICFAPLFNVRSAPLVVCKVKHLYVGISKDIIISRRRSALLVVPRHPTRLRLLIYEPSASRFLICEPSASPNLTLISARLSLDTNWSSHQTNSDHLLIVINIAATITSTLSCIPALSVSTAKMSEGFLPRDRDHVQGSTFSDAHFCEGNYTSL